MHCSGHLAPLRTSLASKDTTHRKFTDTPVTVVQHRLFCPLERAPLHQVPPARPAPVVATHISAPFIPKLGNQLLLSTAAKLQPMAANYCTRPPTPLRDPCT